MDTVRSAGGKTPAPSQNPSRGDPHGGETPFDVESAKRNQKYLKKHASPNVQSAKVPDLSADAGP